MTALITGASAGIGMEMAKILIRTHDVILVARRKERLEQVRHCLEEQEKKRCGEKANRHSAEVFVCDVSSCEECRRLYETFREREIDIVINGAGFGVFGDFLDNDLDRELDMLKTNMLGLHVLMKLFLKDMVARDAGYLLNIASSAGYMPGGPKLAAYYASKAYVLNLTRAVAVELRDRGSHVYLGALCPGPVQTEFNRVAGVKHDISGITAKECARIAVAEMKKRRTLIIPGGTIKLTYLGRKLIPDGILLAVAHGLQKKKE